MKIDYITFKGVSELNEDSLIINENNSFYGVADGVSSLIPFKTKENYTGGYIASNEVKEYFESLLSPSNNLFDDLVTINENIETKMNGYGIDTNRKEQLWGTALAVVKVSETGIEYIQTGDCMILAVYQNEVRPLTRLQVDHLEKVAINRWKECIQKGIKTREELRKKVEDILLMNRKKSNTLNGYGVLNGESQASNYFEYGKINKDGLKHLLLLTDGMYLPLESIPNGLNYWDYVANNIIDKGIEQYAKDLIDMEEADPECLKYPRFKRSDDKAGIIMDFSY